LAQEFLTNAKTLDATPPGQPPRPRTSCSSDWQRDAEKWLNFLDQMHEGTMTLAQRLKDAPYLLWPVAALLVDRNNANTPPALFKRCLSAFSVLAAQYAGVEAAPLRGEVAAAFEAVYRSASAPTRTILAAHLPEIIRGHGGGGKS
uniref:FAT domain-containing protein n=1 Tax=Mesocestoides corti TaxID=53468 RepID=A0A5K3FYS9_MESCO